MKKFAIVLATARCTVLGSLLAWSGMSPARAQETAPHFVNPTSLAKPTGFTQVVVAADGRTVYIAGQVAFDSTGRVVGAGDFAAQADQVYGNLRRALASVGGSMSDIVRTTTYITDVRNVAPLRETRVRYLDPTHPPANSLILLPALSRPDLLLEIEATAILRQPYRP